MSGETTTKSRRQSRRNTRQADPMAERLMIAHSIPALSVRQLAPTPDLHKAPSTPTSRARSCCCSKSWRSFGRTAGPAGNLAASIPEADIDQAMKTLAAWLAGIPDRQYWAALALELQLYAFRNPEFRAQYKAAEARVTAQFRVLIEGQPPSLGSHSACPPMSSPKPCSYSGMPRSCDRATA